MPTPRAACLIAFLALLASVLSAPAWADSFVELPPGETLVDFAWADNVNLTLLVELDGLYALRRFDTSASEISVIPVPKSFSRITPGQSDAEVSLAPWGNAVAFLARSANPLLPAELTVYRLDPAGLKSIRLTDIPPRFNINQFCWGERCRSMYLAATPYLHPEQPHSIGRLDLISESFSGTILRDNLDLIDRLAWLPQRDQLAVVCRGYQGDYPLEPLLALVDLRERTTAVLHGRAQGLQLNALASGDLLIYYDGVSGSSGESWLLPLGSSELQLGKLAQPGSEGSCQAARSAGWIGYLGSGAQGAVGGSLNLFNSVSGELLQTSVMVDKFRISPDGRLVCASQADGRQLVFYSLPEPETN